jgi:hypothetical protein
LHGSSLIVKAEHHEAVAARGPCWSATSATATQATSASNSPGAIAASAKHPATATATAV